MARFCDPEYDRFDQTVLRKENDVGKGIEIFGGLFVFTFCILLIPQMLSFAVSYKTINEMTSTIVEIIEVHEGMTEPARLQIEQCKNQIPEVSVTIEKQTADPGYTYKVTGMTGLSVDLIGLKTDVKTSKTTKRVIY